LFLANTADAAVVSIGYRLAPEDPFPRGPEDCYDAADYLVKNAEEEYGGPVKFLGGEVRPELVPLSQNS
jgi:acetyl esterase/lipase